MGTKTHNNYEDLITFTRASAGHALRPVSYGDELVENGAFDSDISGWTILGSSATATWNSSGCVDLDRNGGTSALFRDQLTVEVGKIYLLSFDILAISHALRPLVNNTSITASVLNATGSYTVSFVAPSSAINLDFSLF